MSRAAACGGAWPTAEMGADMAIHNTGQNGNFEAFKRTIEEKFMHHPVVTSNEYTRWFSQGDIPLDHLRHFTVQFSVFSNQFLLAALNRVLNADTLEAAREAKEILMNELGVIYNKPGKSG